MNSKKKKRKKERKKEKKEKKKRKKTPHPKKVKSFAIVLIHIVG